MKLYSYWRSSSSWRVRIALNFKNVPYDYEAVHLVKDGGQQNTAAYEGKNPLRTVPMLEWEEGGKVQRLAESLAIVLYLEDRYPAPPLLPKEPLAKAQAWMLAEICNAGIQPLQNQVVTKKVKADFNADDQAWAGFWNERGLKALETRCQALSGKFCVGDSVTVADVCLVPQLFSARRFGVDLKPFPTLTRIEAACEGIDAFAKARPERQPDAQP